MPPEHVLCWACLHTYDRAHVVTLRPATHPEGGEQDNTLPSLAIHDEVSLCHGCLALGSVCAAHSVTMEVLEKRSTLHRAARQAPRCLVCGADAAILWHDEDTAEATPVPLCSKHYRQTQPGGRPTDLPHAHPEH